MIEKGKSCGCPCIERMMSKNYPDEQCSAVSPDYGLYGRVARVVKYSDPHTGEHTERKYSLMEMVSVDDHYIALICGGNNGSPVWSKYLLDLSDIMLALDQAGINAWVIRIENDCPDDIHYVYIGLRELKTRNEKNDPVL